MNLTYLLQYYTDPRSGYVFRSKQDVLRYLESGEISRHAFKPKKSCINNEELINSEISVSLHLAWCFSKWMLCCAVFSIIILFGIPSFPWQSTCPIAFIFGLWGLCIFHLSLSVCIPCQKIFELIVMCCKFQNDGKGWWPVLLREEKYHRPK